MRMTIAAMMMGLTLLPMAAWADQPKEPGSSAWDKRKERPMRQRGLSDVPAQQPAAAAVPSAQLVRTFIVELHDISREDHERATKGHDFRLASVGTKPRPHAHFEMRGQGDVFTGWTSGTDMPYESAGARRYEFTGTVGEVQPSDIPGFRRLMLKDSRLVKFYSFRDSDGNRSRIPIVRKSEISLDFPLDGRERSEVYAIPRGKKKFEYRLLTVREDVSKRRMMIYANVSDIR